MGAKRQVVLGMIANGRLYRIAPNGLSFQSRPNDRSFSSLSNKSFSEKKKNEKENRDATLPLNFDG